MEVKFDSRETALHVRSAFVQVKKANMVDLGNIHVSNVVTLATRVRSDIRRAVAEQRSKPNKLSMFVSAFNSRPVIHVRDLPNGPKRVMTLLSLSLDKSQVPTQSFNLGESHPCALNF